MTQFYYSGQYLWRRMGRAVNGFTQVQAQKGVLPAPEAVLVSGRAASGWSLSTWRQVANTRRSSLKAEMLKAINQLEREEVELSQKYAKDE